MVDYVNYIVDFGCDVTRVRQVRTKLATDRTKLATDRRSNGAMWRVWSARLSCAP